mgnify:CR=1 FL=1
MLNLVEDGEWNCCFIQMNTASKRDITFAPFSPLDWKIKISSLKAINSKKVKYICIHTAHNVLYYIAHTA